MHCIVLVFCWFQNNHHLQPWVEQVLLVLRRHLVCRGAKSVCSPSVYFMPKEDATGWTLESDHQDICFSISFWGLWAGRVLASIGTMARDGVDFTFKFHSASSRVIYYRIVNFWISRSSWFGFQLARIDFGSPWKVFSFQFGSWLASSIGTVDHFCAIFDILQFCLERHWPNVQTSPVHHPIHLASYLASIWCRCLPNNAEKWNNNNN